MGESETKTASLIRRRSSDVLIPTRSICTELGAANRAEAVAIALRKHLLKT